MQMQCQAQPKMPLLQQMLNLHTMMVFSLRPM